MRSTIKFAFFSIGIFLLGIYIFHWSLALTKERENFISFSDFLHPFYTAVNFSTWIFWLLYTTLLIALLFIIKQKKLLVALLAYGILLLMRAFFVIILPLNEPVNAIPLKDMVLSTFYPNGYSPYDLFFSGHVATTVLCVLLVNNYYLKLIFIGITLLIGTLLLLQKVHYTIDIIGAPFFTFLSYTIAQKFEKKIVLM